MTNSDQPIRLCRVVTVSMTFTTLLNQQLKVIADQHIDLTLVSSPSAEVESLARQYGLKYQGLPMAREISPLKDVRAVIQLARIFRAGRFDIVHSSTPKAGLVTALAGWLARIPIRLHTYTGQRWVELHGLPRALTRFSDRVIGWLTTQSYADSPSQRDFLLKERIVRAAKLQVLASGSISGVDLQRFDPARWKDAQAEATRRELGISLDAVVIAFVGRLTRDKGIVELVEAFDRLTATARSLELLLVGPFEPDQDPLPPTIVQRLQQDPHIHVTGFISQPERYLGAADIFCLPSYREGFGTVAIEAAALGLPAVVTSIVGLIDAVVPNETGLWCRAKDVEDLRAALQRLLAEPDLCTSLGQRALKRARELFDARFVNQVVVDEYLRLFEVRRHSHVKATL